MKSMTNDINRSDQEPCTGCALEKLCHKSIVDSSDEADGCMRRKATWLMFWIPLIIIALGLFLMVGLAGWDELLSFAVVVVGLATYYIILRLTIGR